MTLGTSSSQAAAERAHWRGHPGLSLLEGKASVEEKADKGEMTNDVPWTCKLHLDPLEGIF